MSNPEFVIRSSKRKKQILNILKDEKYMFLSELSRRINLSIVTTRQHAEELLTLNLIKKEHSGKFVFYSLTTSGEDLILRMNKFS